MKTAWETERLIIRPPEMSDAPALAKAINDPDIAYMTCLIPHPYELSMAHEWISDSEQNWDKETACKYAIINKNDQTFMGSFGFHFTPCHYRAELGFWLGKAFWGRGIMFEAVHSSLPFLFSEGKIVRLEADARVDNIGSQRVLEKLGMQREGLHPKKMYRGGAFHDLYSYGLVKEDILKA